MFATSERLLHHLVRGSVTIDSVAARLGFVRNEGETGAPTVATTTPCASTGSNDHDLTFLTCKIAESLFVPLSRRRRRAKGPPSNSVEGCQRARLGTSAQQAAPSGQCESRQQGDQARS